ncbi:S8 family serine peptidase [Lentzea flaviverrucosa]|uniref:Proprotein convertase P-domain-containing protein n=1 Tax=Lentzea flaviverrucosa TaxID=200379 RepID=A0A1H9KS57_9PSEU|nr:S8 family serine peptidase [Lentzea flaviverrucosa]RDI17965.1 proprotein convertase P-domain-containing protein [Lentzea flaviverrucosa]SER01715.1 Proprotein convertase P-domain-containing protein [Lentzea flaviverrucosa]
MRRSRRGTTLVTAGTAVLLAALTAVTPASADPGKASKSISDRTAAQISALQSIKKSLTPAESKVDSALVVEARKRVSTGTTSALPQVQTGVAVTPKSTTLVDIRAKQYSEDLVNAVRAAGGQIRAVSPEHRTVRAEVPVAKIAEIAGRSDVARVEPGSDAMTQDVKNKKDAKSRKAPSKEDKSREVERRLSEKQLSVQAAKVAESDKAHNAEAARGSFRVTGVGVKLCALSDGVGSLTVSQASGELPAVDIVPGQAGSGDEGTAMLEILHDLAPNAELGFATAFNGDASFADNIKKLRFDLGCDVIVDDVIYFNESPFQDGIIARAVDAVVADGAMFFSSAGNQGNVEDGTSGHYEGQFVDSGVGVGKFAGSAHDFNPDPNAKQLFNPLSNFSGDTPTVLHWADPLGQSANDYDLYLVNAQGNVVTFSQNNQDGAQDPYERINTPASSTGTRLAVVKYRGDDKYFALSLFGGRFADTNDGLKKYVTPGTTRGHSAAKGAISVAAAPAAAALPFDLEPGDPANPKGPYPNAFDGTQKPERFTSDGPRKTFFAPDGSPLAETRQKPDITAADGVTTSVPGFAPFFGTSASAPNAAAIAGLVLSGNPTLTPAEVKEALVATAIDIVESGVDNRTGAGIVMADRVLQYTGASPQALARAQKPTIVNDADGSAFLKPGTSATVTVPVANNGDGSAASTSVVLSTTSAGVTIAPRSKYYGNIDPGQTVSNTYKVTVPASAALGSAVKLDARVTYAGSTSPTTSSFTLRVGEPSREFKTFAYTGEPLAIPDNDQTGVSVSLPVTGVGAASNLKFSVDGATCSATEGSTTVGIDHTFVGDLVGTLTSPSGKSVTLFSRAGGTGNNICQAVFDDAATSPFSSVTSANAPFTGSWKAGAPLSSLTAEPVDGTWVFKVADVVGSDRGSIRSVTLSAAGWV